MSKGQPTRQELVSAIHLAAKREGNLRKRVAALEAQLADERRQHATAQEALELHRKNLCERSEMVREDVRVILRELGIEPKP